jgi:Lecithin retinol acyltransferase
MHTALSEANNPASRATSLLQRGEEPPLAAHLITPRALYTHHGIYVGNGRVRSRSRTALP